MTPHRSESSRVIGADLLCRVHGQLLEAPAWVPRTGELRFVHRLAVTSAAAPDGTGGDVIICVPVVPGVPVAEYDS
jgi:hypothetical protein